MDAFVGRRRELGVLRARLRAAGRGRPHVVAVQGPAGIGKTALLAAFVAQATRAGDAATVLRAGGEEAETLVAFGVLEQLARSAGSAGEALRSAVTPAAADPVVAGTGLLALLGDVEAAGPVLLLVDDLHWVDQPSVRALVFALRRLVADPVLAVLAVRDDGADALPEGLRRVVTGHQGELLPLPGLDERELRELATRRGIGTFPMRAARRLHAGTRGNPLHARAVLDEAGADAWDDRRQPLPSPRSFRRVVGDRHAACSEDTRRLVDAAAVLGVRAALPLAAAVGDVGDPVAAVDEAVRRDLLVAETSRQPWRVAFPHPLVRSAVYEALGPVRRTALHVAAAARVENELAALHHRVAAAPAPDAALADDLAAFAHRAVAAQQWQSATRHLVESGRLCPDREEGRRRLLLALSWMLQSGDAASAAVLADDLRAMPAGPLRDSVLASLAMARDDPAAAEDLFRSAWARVDDRTDPGVAATIALQTAVHRFGRLDGAGTVVWCERALALAGPDGGVVPTARTYLAHGLGYAGRPAEAVAAVAAAAEGDPRAPGADWLQPRSARGTLRLVEDDLDGARADFAAVATRAYELGLLNTAAFAFAYLARSEYLAGAWDEAVVHAERAVAVNDESDWGFTAAMALGIAVLVPAARGEWDAAEATLAASPGRAAGGYERSVVALAMARARVAEARGDAGALVAALEPVRAFPVRDGADEPGFWAWPDLYAEGLVGLGRAAEADALLVPHEQRAAARGRCSSVARLARARGRVEAALGRAERAADAFEHALAASARVALPFERAKVELAAGGFWRRAGQRRKAADLLTAAAATFDALGATPYADRCRRELAGSGLQPAARDGVRADAPRSLLTSQELVVARLAAAGRTNKEIAAELVVSVKTVEYHLRNAFLKLGVQRRRQLAERLADRPTPV